MRGSILICLQDKFDLNETLFEVKGVHIPNFFKIDTLALKTIVNKHSSK